MSRRSAETPNSPSPEAVDSPHVELLSTPQPQRTRLLVLISAWWTLAQMERLGVSFHDFLEAARAKDGEAPRLWDELTRRLHALTTDALVAWPEAVLSPEARGLIEAIVSTMGRRR